MKNKSIILLSPTPPPVMGPSMATQILLQSSFTERFEVHLLDTADRRSLSNIGKIDLINLWLPVKHWFQLAGKLLMRRAQVVYIPISQTALGYLKEVPLIFLARLFGREVILHLRGAAFGAFYQETNALMKWLVRLSLRASDKMIVLSERLKSLFDGLLPPEKLFVVPNGCQMPALEYFSAIRQQEKKLIVLFLANFMSAKGVWEVLEAACILTREFPDVLFVFAGERVYEADTARADRFVRENRLEKNILFTGSVEASAKAQWLGRARLFVFPSHMEGMPWVLIEAMAAGLPMVVTPVGAVPDLVEESVNGYLVPVSDVEALAEAIASCLRDPVQCLRMGQASRKRYEQRYTQSHFIHAMIRVFEQEQDADNTSEVRAS